VPDMTRAETWSVQLFRSIDAGQLAKLPALLTQMFTALMMAILLGVSAILAVRLQCLFGQIVAG